MTGAGWLWNTGGRMLLSQLHHMLHIAILGNALLCATPPLAPLPRQHPNGTALQARGAKVPGQAIHD